MNEDAPQKTWPEPESMPVSSASGRWAMPAWTVHTTKIQTDLQRARDIVERFTAVCGGPEVMNNDLIRLACEQAVNRFGVGDTFNAANFAAVFAKLAGVEGRLDGAYVRAILTGRPDIEILHGSAHFRLLSLDYIARRYRSYAA